MSYVYAKEKISVALKQYSKLNKLFYFKEKN